MIPDRIEFLNEDGPAAALSAGGADAESRSRVVFGASVGGGFVDGGFVGAFVGGFVGGSVGGGSVGFGVGGGVISQTCSDPVTVPTHTYGNRRRRRRRRCLLRFDTVESVPSPAPPCS